jgi:hypothetical protein
MKILLSKNQFEFSLPELKLPDGKVLPAVYLPKKQYKPTEVMVNGPRKGFPPRPVIELGDLEVERLMASEMIRGLFANGTYEWLDKVPESMKTSEDLVAEQAAKIAQLQAELAAAKPKTEEPKPVEMAAKAEEVVLEEPAPVAEKPKGKRGKSKESAGPVDTDSIENDDA